ncbi:glycosyltransferase family 2 protein [Polynucleobacter sp. MWH-Berg-3C6]|nr:glycosyltransferase family 2 protein [Polynucleobacter sp. MWH-Berg-3C6]
MISIACPFFNEEKLVDKFFTRLIPVLNAIKNPFEVICVNDGSTDLTLMKLMEQSKIHKQLVIIDLSRNFGKEAALTAALDYASGSAVIPIDVDLQDPPELIPKMIEVWCGGAEVVLARRRDRRSDTWAKRSSALMFYRIHNMLSESPIPENVGDFRLMDRKVVEAIKDLPESRRFMKGIFAWVGFKTEIIEYTRDERVAGESKFNGWRLWNFALEGITSFSTAPLRVWLYLGIIVASISMSYALIIAFKTIIFGIKVPGYASLIVSTLFLGGIQLVGIGVLGEYIGRIYLESKRRPKYIVREVHANGRLENK